MDLHTYMNTVKDELVLCCLTWWNLMSVCSLLQQVEFLTAQYTTAKNKVLSDLDSKFRLFTLSHFVCLLLPVSWTPWTFYFSWQILDLCWAVGYSVSWRKRWFPRSTLPCVWQEVTACPFNSTTFIWLQSDVQLLLRWRLYSLYLMGNRTGRLNQLFTTLSAFDVQQNAVGLPLITFQMFMSRTSSNNIHQKSKIMVIKLLCSSI